VQLKIIVSFIKKRYNYPDSKIDEIKIKTYDDKKYLIVNIKESFCKIIHESHDKDIVYIVFSRNGSKEKCRICDNNLFTNKIDSREYPQDLNDTLDLLLVTHANPEKTLQTFL
jgi:hypothetical protein